MTATAVANAPTSVTSQAATFQGVVNPDGAQGYAWFEYGLTTAYGASTPSTDVGSGSADVPISHTVSSLIPNTVYHYRAVLSTVDPTPSSWSVATPGSTGLAVTTINDPSGPGINATTTQAVHDVIVNGGGDSAVLFQLGAAGSSLKRAALNDVASRVVQAAGKHGVYAKAQNILCEDIDITAGTYCASGLSMREAGFVGRRVTIGRPNTGQPPIALSYYETVSTEGAVLCEHMIVYCSDTVIWLSYDTDTSSVHQNFTFRDILAYGPSWFLRVDKTFGPGLKAGKTVTLDNCYMNDVKITAANWSTYIDSSTISFGALVFV